MKKIVLFLVIALAISVYIAALNGCDGKDAGAEKTYTLKDTANDIGVICSL
jgi:hypothetical protein